MSDIQKRPNQPLTSERKDKFLKVLEKTGSFSRAAKAASPHCAFGHATFYDEVNRNPDFAAMVAEARSAFLGLIEETITHRAIEGTLEPVFHEGAVVGHRRKHDNKLLLRVAEKLDPSWAPRSHATIDANVKAGVLVVEAPCDSEEEWRELEEEGDD